MASGNFQPRDGFYQRALDFILSTPVMGIGLGCVLPILGFMAATQLKEQFFPPADRDQLHIELELSPTSSLAGTLQTTATIRRVLLQEEGVLGWIGLSARVHRHFITT